MSRRSLAELLVLQLLLVALLALFFYKPGGTAAGTPDLREVPRLFVEAVYHLNSSSTMLRNPARWNADFRSMSANASRIAGEIASYRNALSEMDPSDLVLRLLNASDSYGRMANASSSIYAALDVLSGSKESIQRYLAALEECNAAEAHRLGLSIAGNLSRAYSLVGLAAGNLSLADPSTLLSQSHVDAHRNASEAVDAAQRYLKQLLLAVDITSKHPEELDALCKARKAGRSIAVSEQLAGSLGALNPPDAGPFSYAVSRLKSLLYAVANAQRGGGSGAGYGAPSSDD